LNALIYEMAERNMLFSRFEVKITSVQPTACSLRATVWGEKIDRAKHQPVVEIKGATYTSLKVFEDKDHIWHAQTVVDV
jgi:tRNA nucleotidyltransferase (CCA-adding enzyme)